MLEQINKENFQHMLSQFSTGELEGMIEKFPYFQQAHILLAKKYQQENSPKFDQQLQLAALYTQDRELLFNLFKDKNTVTPVSTVKITRQPEQEKKQIEVAPPVEIVTIASIKIEEIVPAAEKVVAENKEGELDLQQQIQQIEESARALTSMIENAEKEKSIIQSPQPEIEEEVQQTVIELAAEEEKEPETEEIAPVEEKPVEIFSRIYSHTFDEWLKAFNNESAPKVKEEEVVAENKLSEEDELNQLLAANISVDYLHELVKEETTYSKGLDKFIAEQIKKHKQPEVSKATAETDQMAESVTETLAKVYEMQKKYLKAIKTYEALSLKFPEKSSFFAARINYLKNIV